MKARSQQEPTPDNTIPPQRHRIGCLLGCSGYGHDAHCPVGQPVVVRGGCSLDYRCTTMSLSVLADEAYVTCQCPEAVASHAGGVM